MRNGLCNGGTDRRRYGLQIGWNHCRSRYAAIQQPVKGLRFTRLLGFDNNTGRRSFRPAVDAIMEFAGCDRIRGLFRRGMTNLLHRSSGAERLLR